MPVAPHWRLGQPGFAIIGVLVDILTVVGLSVLTGALYHIIAYGGVGMVEFYARLGILTAGLYVLPFVFRNEYTFNAYLERGRSLGRIAWLWAIAFAALAVIGFITKTTEMYSRGWLLLFFVAGPFALSMTASVTRATLRKLIDVGRVVPRRLMLIGDRDALDQFEHQMQGNARAVKVAATIALPYRNLDEDDTSARRDFANNLEDAVARARSMQIDDVIIFSEWSNQTFTEHAVEAFSALPATIHLGASDLIGRFRNARIWRLGDVTTVSLTVPPLSIGEALLKRLFDGVMAATAVILLSPLFALIALAIRWETPGPVLFHQRRRGFNQEEFRIFKFRTMTTLDDGDVIVQAGKKDARVTRVGQWLRRWNLDELPQLINVLRGEMSLVGPRPHAVAHDKLYEKRLFKYPRRLNMRPGITGWAQVHGLRGATETDAAMQQRVEYDLYYIENWSLGLDLYILWLTVFSRRAYNNAH